MITNMIHHHSESIFTMLCVLTSLTSIGCILIDSRGHNTRKQISLYDQTKKELSSTNDIIYHQIEKTEDLKLK